MTNEDRKKLFKVLSAPFTDEAIERTEGRVTGKGYDTTGIKYIYVAARLNEVLGLGGYRTEQNVKVREGTTSKGRAVFDAACDLTLQLGEWIDGKFIAFAEAFSTGGHQSVSEADARKGAYTNAFKKAAAMFGCGQQAYMGTLDDDNVPNDDTSFPPPPETRTQPAPQHRLPPATHAHEERQPPPQSGGENSNTGGNGNGRVRLSSKQLAAIWAIARKLNYNQSDFRKQVKQQYGVQVEFLDKTAASDLIGKLSARASNGGSHPAGEHAGQGAEA